MLTSLSLSTSDVHRMLIFRILCVSSKRLYQSNSYDYFLSFSGVYIESCLWRVVSSNKIQDTYYAKTKWNAFAGFFMNTNSVVGTSLKVTLPASAKGKLGIEAQLYTGDESLCQDAWLIGSPGWAPSSASRCIAGSYLKYDEPQSCTVKFIPPAGYALVSPYKCSQYYFELASAGNNDLPSAYDGLLEDFVTLRFDRVMYTKPQRATPIIDSRFTFGPSYLGSYESVPYYFVANGNNFLLTNISGADWTVEVEKNLGSPSNLTVFLMESEARRKWKDSCDAGDTCSLPTELAIKVPVCNDVFCSGSVRGLKKDAQYTLIVASSHWSENAFQGMFQQVEDMPIKDQQLSQIIKVLFLPTDLQSTQNFLLRSTRCTIQLYFSFVVSAWCLLCGFEVLLCFDFKLYFVNGVLPSGLTLVSFFFCCHRNAH